MISSGDTANAWGRVHAKFGKIRSSVQNAKRSLTANAFTTRSVEMPSNTLNVGNTRNLRDSLYKVKPNLLRLTKSLICHNLQRLGGHPASIGMPCPIAVTRYKMKS
ncbi:hypothetical protein Q31b_29380 [Novipirellula aureliae]|uniref:Uncharacterized protein n=1 Tax=Novipirellula aureliae TaxID=2527966 RepID=A0A5C6E2W5_9BACT|nr:hypothetical protein Q31b_29380 [Novipirellula aureliae]